VAAHLAPTQTVPLPSAVLHRAAAADPGSEALAGAGGRFTYAELNDAVSSASASLIALGAEPGTRIAACMGNRSELVVAFLATMRIGAIWVGINPSLAPPEIEFQVGDCAARILLAPPGQTSGLRGSRLPDLVHVVEDLTAGAPEAFDVPPFETDPHAPAAIAYTSGTTGRPKGVVHSQYNMMVVATGAGGRPVPTDRDRVGVCLPLALLNLMILGPLTAFSAGASCVLLERRDARSISKAIVDERITTMALVPTLLHDLFDDPSIDTDRLLRDFHPSVGGSDCPPAWRRLFSERGLEVNQTYGLTEAPTTVTRGVAGQPDGSSGRALPHIDLSIRDGRDRRLPAGQAGEICIGPTNDGPKAGLYTTMLGYWNDPEATAAALRGGVVHTGDLGIIDEDGFLYVQDRGDDLILRGGSNVYPAEVERVLSGQPGVAGCAVVGIPDGRLGQVVAAAVEPRPGVALTEERLIRACARQLARYKVPERIVFVDRLPRTAMGKVRRGEARSLFFPDKEPA
jgi:long-chain acyl-CoA synthetase